MGRKLANKVTKELIDESSIRDTGLSKTDFTTSWQGRIAIIDLDKSTIAKKIGIDKRGEYAIKVR
ncbi:TPA: hypothetical protein HA361_00865 [Candidatus Woesearchaeota archaeon]|nr:hypothetical protein [Candidatus Woesearchaeota archaeon]